MKILLLSSRDITGGAARAAYRLHRGLLKTGIESKMLVLSRSSDDKTVLAYSDYVPVTFYQKLLGKVSAYRNNKKTIGNNLKVTDENRNINSEIAFWDDFTHSVSLLKILQKTDFDILHIHWCDGFLDIEELRKINKPIVCTLHDCKPFTAVCHYFEKCQNYRTDCFPCTILPVDTSLPKLIFKKKKAVYSSIDIHFIAPSNWICKSALESRLLRNSGITVLPNTIDSNLFSPVNPIVAKQALKIENNTKVLLFGAMSAVTDRRKGLGILRRAVELLKTKYSSTELLLMIFGADPDNYNYGFNTKFLGNINNDEYLNIIYSAADVLVLPSYYENLSCVVMEALASATPVVAFDTGGNSDMVEHKQNGYLSQPYSAESLAEGIDWCFNNNKNNILGLNGRRTVLDKFDESVVAEQHINFYKKLLQ